MTSNFYFCSSIFSSRKSTNTTPKKYSFYYMRPKFVSHTDLGNFTKTFHKLKSSYWHELYVCIWLQKMQWQKICDYFFSILKFCIKITKNKIVLLFWQGSNSPNYYETMTNRQDFWSSTTFVFTKNSDFGGHLVSTYHLCYN